MTIHQFPLNRRPTMTTRRPPDSGLAALFWLSVALCVIFWTAVIVVTTR